MEWGNRKPLVNQVSRAAFIAMETWHPYARQKPLISIFQGGFLTSQNNILSENNRKVHTHIHKTALHSMLYAAEFYSSNSRKKHSSFLLKANICLKKRSDCKLGGLEYCSEIDFYFFFFFFFLKRLPVGGGRGAGSTWAVQTLFCLWNRLLMCTDTLVLKRCLLNHLSQEVFADRNSFPLLSSPDRLCVGVGSGMFSKTLNSPSCILSQAIFLCSSK